ncbi:MAG: ProQ/FinO family protein [Silvanigrellaceae bacterium]|nr:ProQ/FinO family protein [Silvanigrellaceae bacterium]
MNQPKDFKNFRKRRQEALSWLRQNFPAAFSETNIQPLKIGIYHDIFAIKTEGMPTKKWGALALKYYTGSRSYRMSMKENASRVDLNGDIAGVVTKEEADSAKSKLQQYNEFQAQKLALKKKIRSSKVALEKAQPA